MYYRSPGKGKPVVLLHGFCETGQVWDSFYPELAKEHHILIPDLPGFGKSDPLPAGFRIKDVAESVFQWMHSLKIEKAAVIGHSLGGYVALELAKAHPGAISGLGLFHSTAFADTDEKKETRNKVIEFVKNNSVEVFADTFIPQLFYTNNRSRLEADVNQMVKIARATALETLVEYTRAMRDRNDCISVLKELDTPILFIAGDRDTSVPLEKSQEQVPMIKNPVFHILKDTGHMGMFESRELALKFVKEFLDIVPS